MYGGLDIDIPLSSKFFINGGFNYSQVEGESLIGLRTGLGIGGTSGIVGVRIDFGLNWQQYYYEAYSVLEQEIDPPFGDPYTRTVYYHDTNKNTNLNHYIAITISTLTEDFPVNGFVNAAYSKQNILD